MAAVYRPGLMPAKRTMRSLAIRSGTRLFCAARSCALVGFHATDKGGLIRRLYHRSLSSASVVPAGRAATYGPLVAFDEQLGAYDALLVDEECVVVARRSLLRLSANFGLPAKYGPASG